jgi:hypothetical protein
MAVSGCCLVGCAVVFCEYSGAVFGTKDDDCVDGEEGHAGCHGWRDWESSEALVVLWIELLRWHDEVVV